MQVEHIPSTGWHIPPHPIPHLLEQDSPYVPAGQTKERFILT